MALRLSLTARTAMQNLLFRGKNGGKQDMEVIGAERRNGYDKGVCIKVNRETG